MAYADYAFYRSSFHGKKIPSEDFAYYAEKASDFIDSKLGVQSAEFKVKKACCAVAETLLLNEQGGGVVSETVGDYSVSFANGVSNTKTHEQRLTETLQLYFSPVRWC